VPGFTLLIGLHLSLKLLAGLSRSGDQVVLVMTVTRVLLYELAGVAPEVVRPLLGLGPIYPQHFQRSATGAQRRLKHLSLDMGYLHLF
jgi:hypothetical protein